MNSLRHGFYARRILIEVGDGKEEREEWEALLHAFTEDYRPVGVRETLLVESIAYCDWRLLRAARAETGEIRKSADHALHEHTERVTNGASRSILMGTWRGNSSAIELMVRLLTTARQWVAEGTEVSETLLQHLFSPIEQFDLESPVFTCMVFSQDWKAAKARSPEEATQVQQHFLKYLDSVVCSFNDLLPLQREREGLHAKATLDSCAIPLEGFIDRGLKYETQILKQRALHEAALNAAQQRRRTRATTSPMPNDENECPEGTSNSRQQ